MTNQIKLSTLIAPTYREVWQDMLDGKHSIYAFTGGRSSGKSSLISLRIIYELVSNPNACCLCLMAYANNLELGVVAQVQWAISAFGLDEWFTIKKSPWQITYKPTGSKIVFRGLDDPNKLKGLKMKKGKWFTCVWIDECSMLKNFDQIRQTQLTVARDQPKGTKLQVLLSTNPPRSFNNWFNIWHRSKRLDVYYKHTSYLDLPREWISETFLQEAEYVKGANYNEYEYTFLGLPVKNEGAVFKNLDFKEFTDDDYQMFSSFNCGIDFGFSNDPTTITLNYFNSQTKTLYIFGERYFHSGDADVIYYKMRELAEEFPWTNLLDAKHSIFCDADGIGKPIEASLSKLGLGTTPAFKGPNSREPRMLWMQSFNKIVIDNIKCPNTAREFSDFSFKKTRAGDFIDKIPDGDDHSIDATAYSLSLQWRDSLRRTQSTIMPHKLTFQRQSRW